MRPNWKQKQTIFKALNLQPFPLQSPPLRDDVSRVVQVIGGERGGKSFVGSMEGSVWPFFTDLVWLVGPDYEQARPEFEAICVNQFKLGNLYERNYSMPKEGKCTAITNTGCTIETKTSEDVRKLASKAPGLAVMCEAAQQTYDTFLKLRGRVAEKRGVLWMTGTLEEGSAWYTDLYNTFQSANVFGGRSYSIPSWANLGVYPGGERDPEILALKAALPEALFLERHAAVPRKPSNVVFPEFDYVAHVSDVLEYQPQLPVFLAIDPGFAGAYAVLACHVLGNKVWAFDEIYEQRPERGTDSIIDEARSRDWWGDVDDIVIDVAGHAANLTDGRSVSSMWHEATLRDKIGGERGIYPYGETVGITDGIDRYRRFLGNPKNPESVRIGYHPRCASAIKEHGLYRYPKRRMSINRADSERPVDANNHALKAMTYLIIHKFGYHDGPPPATKIAMALAPQKDPWLVEEADLPMEYRP